MHRNETISELAFLELYWGNRDGSQLAVNRSAS